MSVLVIAAHPDDELLGVGGTIRKLADAGDEVFVFVACEGVSMRYSTSDGDRVLAEARAASKLLGVERISFGGLPDQRLDTMALVDVVSLFEEQVQSVRPSTVYTHCGSDVNRDHRVVLEAVQVATRPYAAPWVREVLLFETPSSSEWGHSSVQAAFVPEVYVDITDTLETKIAAFLSYVNEVRSPPHPRSPEALRARAVTWGSAVGMGAAEPFQVMRSLR